MIIIVVVALALFLGGMYTQKKYPLFTILPEGQCNIDSTGTFKTNIDPITSDYKSYTGTGAWIYIKGSAWKYGSSLSCSARCGECQGSSNPSATLLVENYNSAGDDIYYSGSGQERVAICSASGTAAKYFLKDSSIVVPSTCTGGTTCTPDNSCAALTCSGQTCTNNCGTVIPGTKDCSTACTSGTQQCLSSTTYKICTNGAWSGILQCSGTCSNNQCVTSGNCIIMDSNGNGKVDRDELGTAISRWASNA